jgi:antitoxin VapB
MALNIKDKETEALVNELAALTGESKTKAVRKAAQERLDRLKARSSGKRFRSVDDIQTWLETEIWPQIPSGEYGKPVSKAEREEILGYGPEGV